MKYVAAIVIVCMMVASGFGSVAGAIDSNSGAVEVLDDSNGTLMQSPDVVVPANSVMNPWNETQMQETEPMVFASDGTSEVPNEQRPGMLERENEDPLSAVEIETGYGYNTERKSKFSYDRSNSQNQDSNPISGAYSERNHLNSVDYGIFAESSSLPVKPIAVPELPVITAVGPLDIFWYDDFEEESYSGSIREYLESQGHTVTYQNDMSGMYDAAALIPTYDVIVAEHTCGSGTIYNLDQWFAAGKGYVAMLGYGMYNDPPEDDYIMNLLGVGSDGNSGIGWAPGGIFWTNPVHEIANTPNNGWNINAIPWGQEQSYVSIIDGQNVIEGPGGAILQTLENVEGSGKIAYWGSNYHGMDRTDATARMFVENMIVWTVSSPIFIGPSQSKEAIINSMVQYNLTVNNRQAFTDTINLAVSSTPQGWAVNLYYDDGITLLTDTDGDMIIDVGSLASNFSINIMAKVMVPSTATIGEFDVAKINATSSWNASVCSAAILNTSVISPFGLMLMPPDQTGIGNPGGEVNYTLTIMNTGLSDDTYSISTSGNAWPVHFINPFTPSSTILSEDFEDAFPPVGWSVMQYGDPDKIWMRGDAGEARPNEASGMGLYAIADSDYWWPDTNTGLRTPSFSLVGVATAQLEFDQYYWDIGSADYSEVRVSTDGGSTWDQIALYTTSQGPNVHTTLSLDAFVGQPNLIVEFHYDDEGWDWYWQIDNVDIVCDCISSIGPIPAGNSVDFIAKVSIPGGVLSGTFDTAIVSVTSQNDTIVSDTAQIRTATPIVPPFFDNFESLGPYQNTNQNANPGTQWEWGNPSSYISGPGSAYSGSSCWGTNLLGPYLWGADCFLTLPPIDLSSFTNVEMNFQHWYNIDITEPSWEDGAWVEVSADNGSTWGLLTPIGGYPTVSEYGVPGYVDAVPCYAGNSNGWVPSLFDLSPYAGINNLHIRFRFWSEPWDEAHNYAGWYIDDLSIAPPPQYRFTLSPDFQRNYSLSGSFADYMSTLNNTGSSNDAYNLMSTNIWPVTFWDTSGTIQINSIGPVLAGSNADFIVRVSTPGSALPGDFDLADIYAFSQSDPMVWNVAQVLTHVPYITNWFDGFEGGLGSWNTEVIRPSSFSATEWQIGDPMGWGPGSAYNGSNCAGTNLWDLYYPGADIALVSPFIELGTSPQRLSFNHWYQTNEYGMAYDGGFVEINDGFGWTQIYPTDGYPNTGYMGGYNTDGYSGDSGGWVYEEFDLSPWAGQVVQARFHFASGDGWMWGWYVDNILFGNSSVIAGCELTPDFQSGIGFPGSNVDYLLSLSNNGTGSDIYDLGYMNNNLPWPITFYQVNEQPVFVNPSFETGDFSGWIAQDMAIPYDPLRVGSFWPPTDGGFAAINGFDGGGPDTIILAQDVSLPANVAILEFDYRAWWGMSPYGGTIDREFRVEIEPFGGGTAMQNTVILVAPASTDNSDTGNLHSIVNISAFAGMAVRISFEWFIPESFTGPAGFQLDNIRTFETVSGPISSIGPIMAGSSTGIIARVSIPGGAWPGDFDLANIYATSQSNPMVWDLAQVQTEVPPFSFELNPESQFDYGHPGNTTDYMLTITNTGPQDSYDLFSNSTWPVSFWSESSTLVNEQFEGAFPPAGWTVVDPMGYGTSWLSSQDTGSLNYAGGSGYCADANNMPWMMNTGLRTPSFNLNGVLDATLEFDMSYYDLDIGSWPLYGYAEVSVSTNGGGNWTQIALYDEDHSPFGPGEHVILNLTPFVGNSNVIIEFHFENSWAPTYWWQIDNVNIYCNGALAPITSIGPIPAGSTASFIARVSIPGGALPGDFDLADIYAISQGDFMVWDMAQLLTQVPYTTNWFDGFEGGLGSWNTEVIKPSSFIATEWQIGNPMGLGPGSACSGSNCAGTNLWDIYYPGADIALVSPFVELGTSPQRLSFNHWYQTNEYGMAYDGGFVEINDGFGWAQIYPTDGYPNTGYMGGYNTDGYSGDSGGWVYEEFDLSPWAGQVVQVRYHFASGDGWMWGWYVDDVFMGGPTVSDPLLTISKTGPITANNGETITYTITVTNIGNGTAYDNTLTDPMLGINLLMPNLAPGASLTYFFNYTVPIGASGLLGNTATVTYDNQFGVHFIPVNATWYVLIVNPLMEIQKSAPSTALNGDLITYWIYYWNNGTDWAYNVVITETYPMGVSFVSSIPFPTIGNNVWMLGNIAPGASGAIEVTVSINPSVVGIITNLVTLDYENGAGIPMPQETASADTMIAFQLQLNPGWNLFSTPLIPPDTSLNAIFGDVLTGGLNQAQSDKVFKWNPATEQWLVAYLYEDGIPANTGWLFTSGAFTIEPDFAYWVWIRDDLGHPGVTINIFGAIPGERNVPLSVGWNLVGYTSVTSTALQNGAIDSSGLFASGFTGGTSQVTSDRVLSWDGAGWQVQYMWENGDAFDGTWIGTTFNLAPGRGYWIEIRATHAAFNWTYGN